MRMARGSRHHAVHVDAMHASVKTPTAAAQAAG
jgi:hypothetical protein